MTLQATILALLDQDWFEWLLLPGLGLLAVAVIAWRGDRRRMRRSDPDDVGFMPWTSVFFFALFGALILLGLALKAWLETG